MSYRGKKLLQIMQKAQNYNAFVVKLILKSLGDKNKQILDFGSGYGFFAQLLRKQGVNNIKCIEIDEELNEHCKSLDLVVFKDLDQLKAEKFDFIYTLNVIEHIEDDKKVLLLLKDRLKKNGALFIYVPAFEMLYSNFDREIGHFRRYKKNDLTDFLRKSGFEILNEKYTDSLGFMLALLYKIINKKDGTINSTQIIIFDRVLFPIGRLFDRLSQGKLFGKNLIIEARLK